MAFYDLYFDLADQLNDTADDNLTRCKKWINWTLRDLTNLYDFEELQDSVTTTASSYDFKRLDKLTSSTTIGMFSNSSADTAITATVFGYNLAGGTRTYQSENVAINGTATASTTNNFSVIDRIETAEAVGDITVSDGTKELGVILSGETRIANDFEKIIKVDANGDVRPITNRDRLLQFPGDSNFDDKYYTVQGNVVTFYNLGGGTPTIYYQRKHPWMIEDYDEISLRVTDSDIADAAWAGWGLRFEDESDGSQWKAAYKSKLQEIVADSIMGDDLVPRARSYRRR